MDKRRKKWKIFCYPRLMLSDLFPLLWERIGTELRTLVLQEWTDDQDDAKSLLKLIRKRRQSSTIDERFTGRAKIRVTRVYNHRSSGEERITGWKTEVEKQLMLRASLIARLAKAATRNEEDNEKAEGRGGEGLGRGENGKKRNSNQALLSSRV